jgi:hypothetical protein
MVEYVSIERRSVGNHHPKGSSHWPFGAYAQTHEEHDNTMATRTTGAIALRPMGTNKADTILWSSAPEDGWSAISGPNCRCLKKSSIGYTPFRDAVKLIATWFSNGVMGQPSRTNMTTTTMTVIHSMTPPTMTDSLTPMTMIPIPTTIRMTRQTMNPKMTMMTLTPPPPMKSTNPNDDNQPIDPIDMPFAGVEADENDKDDAEHNNSEFDKAHNNDIEGSTVHGLLPSWLLGFYLSSISQSVSDISALACRRIISLDCKCSSLGIGSWSM